MSLQLAERARLYTERHNIAIQKALGQGNDGAVWQTTRMTAIKVCEDAKRYFTERDCYRFFLEADITEICGYSIPRLIEYSNEVMVIEMDIVQPPYILDFGKAYLQRKPPEYSEGAMADWQAEKAELYGERWPEIMRILRRLQSLGIYHMDPKPANILPANWNPTEED